MTLGQCFMSSVILKQNTHNKSDNRSCLVQRNKPSYLRGDSVDEVVQPQSYSRGDEEE
jgi:hypothetical protein